MQKIADCFVCGRCTFNNFTLQPSPLTRPPPGRNATRGNPSPDWRCHDNDDDDDGTNDDDEVSMEDITAMMTAPDPGAAVGAKAISAAAKGAVSQLRGGCPAGWVR